MFWFSYVLVHTITNAQKLTKYLVYDSQTYSNTYVVNAAMKYKINSRILPK